MPSVGDSLKRVQREIKLQGILLASDQRLPSVASIVAGGPIRGSWWGHRDGHRIFSVLSLLGSDEDILSVRLVSGKVTFVHRRFWPELLAICTSHEGWQTSGLSGEGLALLRLVEKRGELRTDSLQPAKVSQKAVGDLARELELRLLVRGEEVHTPRGLHAKVLKSWEAWAEKMDFHRPPRAVSAAKARFERLLETMNKAHDADGKLLWS